MASKRSKKSNRSKSKSATPAALQLQAAGAAFEVAEYEHDPAVASYGLEAAEMLGVDPSTVFKTLMVSLADGSMITCVLPVAERLDLRSVAKHAGAKKAAMADVELAQRRTGYVLGGISPFGQRQVHRTFVDVSAAELPEVYVSGGRRGMELLVAPEVFRLVLNATFGSLRVE